MPESEKSKKPQNTAIELLALGIDLLDGKPGEKGEKGDKGDTGPAGKDSTVMGPKGDKGDTGLTGKDGKDGKDGKMGTDGKDGKQGPKGDTGPAGKDGKDGKDAEVTPNFILDVTTPIIVQNVQKAIASKTYSVTELEGMDVAIAGQVPTKQEDGTWVPTTPTGGTGSSAWGDITGTLSEQGDLALALGAKADALGADDNYVTDAEKVVIGNTSGTNSGDNATNSQYSGLATSKQDTLISGTNIKTINSTSLLGSGDIVISSSSNVDGGGASSVYGGTSAIDGGLSSTTF